MPTRIEVLTDDAFHDALMPLAQLRITVFREWPYLYDGDLEYEASYLERFAKAENAFLAVAIDADTIVGATTAAPLAGEAPEFRAPFEQAGMDTSEIFYFAESILLPQYRGRGIGHRFFDLREDNARNLGGYRYSTFCSVVRSQDHPMWPETYRPLNEFWTRQGYSPRKGLMTEFEWRDVGDNDETSKPMQFWMKEL